MMTKQRITKIEEFIKNNNLQFTEGRRNTDSVALSGYALYVGLTEKDLSKLTDIVYETLPDCDAYTDDELARVFEFAKANNYGKWWEGEEAKKQYKF